MNIGIGCRRLLMSLTMLLIAFVAARAEKPVAKRIFVFGDSMTGWMADRLNAYGEKNGFEVSTLIWDGATMQKYAKNAAKLKRYIDNSHADAVVICLGMNEMGARNPSVQLGPSLAKIKGVIGNLPYIWVGPPTWPSKPQYGPAYDNWMQTTLGSDHYYSSLSLTLPRQSKTNPHPTREGINKWTDDVIRWIESGNGAFILPGYAAPSKSYIRPKNFTYKKMKSPL